MNELTPLQEKIREYLLRFARKEPYITNTAIQISLLMPDELQKIDGKEIRKVRADDYKRGYSAGYQAGKRATNHTRSN